MPVKPPIAFQRGDKIDGRYFVHQALSGERGEVYLCLDLETSRAYALKTIHSRHLNDAHNLDAFYKEVAVRVALESHANIVRCHHHSTIDGRPFMFLEWVLGDEGLGRDIGEWITHQKLDLQQSLTFTIHVCNGLIHAGEKVPGIVHGWLMPGNLLVSKGRVVKINDFGQQSNFQPPVTIRAAPYLAPEQWEGGELDLRTDLYALGCILFEMLSGSPPFEAETLEDLRHLHTSAEVPRLTEKLHLPPELDVLLSRCLAKNKVDRFSSARELLDEISKIYQQLSLLPPSTDQGKYTFAAIEYRGRARTFVSLDRFDDALTDIERALDSDPDNAEIFYERGLIYEQKGNFDKALADFSHAIELDRFNDDAYAARGNIYRKLRQYELALNDLQRALEIDPESVLAHAHRGNTYSDVGRTEEAIEEFDMAIQLAPSKAIFYFNRGSALMNLERFEEAIRDYTRCIEDNFGESSSYTHRAAAYFGLDRYEEAMEDIARAFEVNPNDPFAHLLRGDIHTARQQYETAINDYSVAIEYGYHPMSAAYLKRGIVYAEGKNDYLSSIADLNRAITLNPQLDIAYGARAEAQNQLGNYREALADITKAMELGGDVTESKVIYNTRSKAYWGLGAFEEALADANRALAVEPEEGQSYFNRANAYSGLRRFQDAIRDYNRAIEYNSSFSMSFNNRGASYASIGELDTALTDLIQAIRLDPACSLAYRNIGIVLNEKGAKERAVLYLATAVRFGDAMATEVYPFHSMEVMRAAMESGRMAAAQEAFTSAGSYPDMLLAVTRFPFLTVPLSISSKERALEEMSSSPLYSTWSEQLQWLKACADDMPLPDVNDPKLMSADEAEDDTFVDSARAKQALAAYDSALEQDANNSALLVNKGVVLELLGRIDEALTCHRQALQMDPNQRYAYYFMGILLRKLGNFDEALSCFDRALEIKRDEAEFWRQKARIFDELDKEEEEIVCYDRIIALDPHDEKALVNRGMFFGRKGEYMKALECMERALDEDSELALGWFYKGQALLCLERAGEAIDCFDRSLEIDPTEYRAWMMKGEALRGNGSNEEASLCYIKLSELTSVNAETLETAGTRLFSMNKIEEALRCFEQAVKRSPEDDQAWAACGVALGRLERPEDAISCFDRAIELNSQNISAWFNKGVILVNGFKDHSQAVRCFEQAQALGHEQAGPIIVTVKMAEAAEAFECAASIEEMRDLVSQFPIMATAEFLSSMQSDIEAQESTSDEKELAQLVEWLREVITKKEI